MSKQGVGVLLTLIAVLLGGFRALVGSIFCLMDLISMLYRLFGY